MNYNTTFLFKQNKKYLSINYVTYINSNKGVLQFGINNSEHGYKNFKYVQK